MTKMVTDNDHPLNWAVMSGALLTAELASRKWTHKQIIEICGNRQGIFSLGILLLWLSRGSPYTDSLSITGLPFVCSKSSLSLSVILTMNDNDEHGKLVRTDKDKQFQWLIMDDLLEREAVALLGIAFNPHGYCQDHLHGNVGTDAEYELLFARNDIRREFFPVD